MASEGRFRLDLYYRLSVMTMELPPLRSYKDDNLEVLARVFLKQAAERHGRDVRRIAPATVARLYAYDFPGNVRELKNALEHAVIMASTDTVEPADLPRAILEGTALGGAAPIPLAAPPKTPTLAEARESWLAPLERRYLEQLLASHGGNVRAASRAAGVTPVTLYRLLEKRGMGRSRG